MERATVEKYIGLYLGAFKILHHAGTRIYFLKKPTKRGHWYNKTHHLFCLQCCDCGHIKVQTYDHAVRDINCMKCEGREDDERSKQTLYWNGKPYYPNLQHLVGKKFGNWTVLRHVGYHFYFDKNQDAKVSGALWESQCKCGRIQIVRQKQLKHGKSKSCLKCSNRKHRYEDVGTLNTWRAMLRRCTDSNQPFSDNYIGRGIEVCEEWLQFENFYRDMGERPSAEHSLDRINVNRGYRKENCRWATATEQANNTRAQLHQELFNKSLYINYLFAKMSVAKMSEIFDMDQSVIEAILQRIENDMREVRAMNYQKKGSNSNNHQLSFL